jgi:hypothetical protein
LNNFRHSSGRVLKPSMGLLGLRILGKKSIFSPTLNTSKSLVFVKFIAIAVQ